MINRDNWGQLEDAHNFDWTDNYEWLSLKFYLWVLLFIYDKFDLQLNCQCSLYAQPHIEI